MRPGLLHRLLPWSLSLLCIAALSPAAARAADASTWSPFRLGERWEYRVHRDHQFTPSDAPIDRVFSEGSVVREVTAKERDGNRDLYSVRETVRLLARQTGARPEVETTLGRWSSSDGVQLHANAAEPATRSDTVVYKPPLRWLPAAPDAEPRWQVGTQRWNGTEIALSGELLGHEDVRAGGERFERCLKVRYAGPISGTTPVASGAAPIRSGHIERIVWFAAGVGIVMERITTEGEIEIPPQGSVARVSELQTRELARHGTGQ